MTKISSIIHPTAIVDPDAKIGEGCFIGPYTIISAEVVIYDRVEIGPFCAIGNTAEKHGFFGLPGEKVLIGSDTIIRSHVTIDCGTFRETTISKRCTILRGAHVGHDVILEDDVTLSCNVLVGGESRIMRGGNLGLGAVTHQKTLFGPYSILGMNSCVTKKTPIAPFSKYAGVPARAIGANHLAIDRAKLTARDVEELHYRYLHLKEGTQ